MLPLKVARVSVGPPEPRVPCCWLGKMPVSGKSESITPLNVLATTSAFEFDGTSTSTWPLNVVNSRSRPQFARPIVAVTFPERVAAAGVSIEVVEHSEGVTICAIDPDGPGEPPNECLPGDEGSMSVEAGNDVQVDFTVSVPAGVVFVGRNFSGSVEATDLESDVFASTFSGNVTVSTTEIAEAATFSGNVTATIGLANWGRDLEFTTFSGNVDVEVPSNSNAEVVASRFSGAIVSDFPLTGILPNQRQGTLGSGGPTLTLDTFSGNIRLRSGPES